MPTKGSLPDNISRTRVDRPNDHLSQRELTEPLAVVIGSGLEGEK